MKLGPDPGHAPDFEVFCLLILLLLAIASLVAFLLMPIWSTATAAWQPADGIEQYAIGFDPLLPAQEENEFESESSQKVLPAAPALTGEAQPEASAPSKAPIDVSDENR